MPQLSLPRSLACLTRRRRNRTTCLPLVRRCRRDMARWQYLEEREFGRLAQEADHLFDTSLTW